MHRAAALRGHARHFKTRTRVHPPFGFCTLRLVLALPFLWWLALKEGSALSFGRAALHTTDGFRDWYCSFILCASSGRDLSRPRWCNRLCRSRQGPSSPCWAWNPFLPSRCLEYLVATFGTSLALRVYSTNIGPGPLDVFLLVIQASSYRVYIVLLTRALGQIRTAHEIETRALKESFFRADKPPPGPMLFLFSATLLAEVAIACLGLPEACDGRQLARPSCCCIYGRTLRRHRELLLRAWVEFLGGLSRKWCLADSLLRGAGHMDGVAFLRPRRKITWDQAVGSLLTICGVALVSWVREKEKTAMGESRDGGNEGIRGRNGTGTWNDA